MKEIDNILINQRNYFRKVVVFSTIRNRIDKIKKIRHWIKKNENKIIESCLSDYHKPISEFYATELNPVLNHIDFTLKYIKKWTSINSVWSPMHLLGTRSRIYYEPKGVCLIISPWNYPFNLTLNPIISAIASGNCMVVKPSEFTPTTSSLISEMISSIFNDDEIKVMQGDADLGAYLIQLKFDHIFFTGSPEIGKVVMRAASNNLTSITLELGGKNHAIVDDTANVKDAVQKILWSKYVNSGQTCIAVNHVFVHSKSYDVFISNLEEVLKVFFSNQSDYGEIVNVKHYNRLNNLLKDCTSHSGQLSISSSSSVKHDNSFPITILKDVKIDNPILKNEIFGPILPVVMYDDFNSILDFINRGEKPLALYLFSRSKKNIKKFLKVTSSGTAAINDCMLQYANPYLPFGGVNNSGMGKTGGRSGFLSFSNEKSVLFQISGFSIAKFIYPPYTRMKEVLAKILG